MLAIETASRSEIGQRSNNEDRVAVCHDGNRWLAVLADGAGGHRGGAEAAHFAVEYVQQALRRADQPFGSDALTEAVVAAHRYVLEAQHSGAGPRGMHTTLVALWIDAGQGRALWTHVGDSRLYAVRRGALRQLTSDDSAVQRMVDAGLLNSQQALVHPLKNQLLTALGVEGEIEPHTQPCAVRLEPGDAFLLCSDGWWAGLNEAGILGSLADADSPDEWLEAMQATIASQRQPRQDNFSAIAAWVGPPTASR
jgi:serine/threonine protein phosphatase PrpC